MRQWRLILGVDYSCERKELRDDLSRIEKELSADHPNKGVGRSEVQARSDIIHKEIEHIDLDLKNSAQKMKEKIDTENIIPSRDRWYYVMNGI